MLRTSAYERPEWPDATYAIFLADVGNVLRNYHPATASQSMISKGSGATTGGGSFITTGAAETGWRTGWITGSDASRPNDLVFVMKDLSASGGNGLVKFGTALYDNSNTFIRNGANGNSPRRFFSQYNISGQTTTTPTDTAGDIPMTGVQGYLQRLDPVGKRLRTEHIASGKLFTETYDNWTPTGRIQATVGAIHRGLQGDGTVRGDTTNTGLEFEAAADCLGIVMVAKLTVPDERKGAVTSISGTYDYASIPIGTGGSDGGTTTPPPAGGGVVPAADDVSFVAVADADFDATSFFGATGTLRDKFERIKNFVDNGGLNASGAPYFNRWDDTSKTYRGQYHISRGLANFARAYCFATGATKWLEWSRQAQTLWNKANAILDTNSSPWATGGNGRKGWGYGTKGSGATVNYEGQRIDLEAGVSAGGMAISYLLNKNKHLDPTFQATIDSQCAWYDNNHIPDWTTYHGTTGLGAKPLHARKPFTHAYLAEAQGAFCRASVRAGSLWYNDPLGVAALDAFALWYQASATQVIPTANFKNAAYASYGPARVWGQYVPALKQQGDPQFYQPTGYFNESMPILAFLYLEGFLTRALGTQFAADTFMAEVVSGVNLGVLIEPLRAGKKWAANHVGSYTLSNGTKTSWMFTSPPAWAGTAATEEAASVEGQMWAMGAFDTSNRIGTIHDEWHAVSSGAKAGNKGFFTANVHHIFGDVFRNGRRN